MLVYRFKPEKRSDNRVALTREADGGNLPTDGAPWQLIGTVDLNAADPWVKAPKEEVEAALEARGFFVWAIKLPDIPRRFGKPT